MKKILITGAEGQVGFELQNAFSSLGDVVALGRDRFDLCNGRQMRQVLLEIRPDVIVNAAAYTAVDKAETDLETAFVVNASAPALLAEMAEALGAMLVHYSTDYVFDGTSPHPYHEEDATNPLNVYGKTKLEGERAIAASCRKHLILRTSWVYGARGKNFLLTMLRLGAEKPLLRIVDDQKGAPTWCRPIAQTTVKMVSAMLDRADEDRWGIYHLTNGGVTTWYGFAKEIFAQIDRAPQLEAIPSSAYPLPAKRPSNSVLSNRKLNERFGLSLPSWEESLRECLKSVNF